MLQISIVILFQVISLHYTQFYFCYFIIILYLQLQVNYKILLAGIQHTKTLLTIHNFAISEHVLIINFHCIYSKVPEVEMSIFCYFSLLFFLETLLF